MKQVICPRCEEPFERKDRFCKKCGLRKNRPFSQGKWWLCALLCDLLIMLCVTVVREDMLLAKNQPLDFTTGTSWLMFGLSGLCLLMPTICLSQIYRVIWLLRHGAITSGKVIEHRLLPAPKGRQRIVAIVEFTPDTIHQRTCDVQHGALIGVLPINKQVEVRYDPYNPGSCAQVGLGMSDLIFFGLLSLMFLGLAALIVVAILVTAPVSA